MTVLMIRLASTRVGGGGQDGGFKKLNVVLKN